MKSFDVIVIIAGAAGVGVGMALKRVGVESMIILEREAGGESFLRWPEDMRFITPFFTSNAVGLVDPVQLLRRRCLYDQQARSCELHRERCVRVLG